MTDAPTAAMTNEKKTTAPENYINRVTFGARLKQYARSPLSLILMILVMLAALFSVGMLIFIIAYILINGVPHLTAEQFDWNYTTENVSMMPAMMNTLIMTALTLVIAVPIGVFAAVYLVEYAKRGNKLVKVIRVTTETLSGIPSIVFGLFGYLMFNISFGWGFSMMAGVITLAMMILPLIIRTTEEALLAVPDSYREGSFGLGAGKMRTVFRVSPSHGGARYHVRRYPLYRTYRRRIRSAHLYLRFRTQHSRLACRLGKLRCDAVAVHMYINSPTKACMSTKRLLPQ